MEPELYAPYPLNLVRDWLHRRRNWVRLAVVVVLGVWLGPPGYRLWFAQPVSKVPFDSISSWGAGLNIPPPEKDRTKEMLAAIGTLPTQPSTGPATAPAGQQWVRLDQCKRIKSEGRLQAWETLVPPPATLDFDPTILLTDPWLPARFHLREAINYLELSETRAALQAVSELSGQPHCVANSQFSGWMASFGPYRQAVKLLVGRSRYRLVEKHDFTGAADDIEAALRLAAGVEDDGTIICLMVGIACRSLALEEVAQWGREGLLSKQQSVEMLRRLGGHQFDRRGAMHIALEGEQRFCSDMLNSLYAPGERGRCVLHRVTNKPGDWLVGSLNLLSPLFANRAGSLGFVVRGNELGWVGDPSLAELARRDELLRKAAWNPTIPYALAFQFMHERMAVTCMRAEAYCAGAVTSLGLAGYRAEHGQYPSSLEELAPQYLMKVPADPFSGGPLRYRLERDDRFILYSVHTDGKDDGGSSLRRPEDGDLLDLVVAGPRAEPGQDEWVIMPSAAASQPASGPATGG